MRPLDWGQNDGQRAEEQSIAVLVDGDDLRSADLIAQRFLPPAVREAVGVLISISAAAGLAD